MTNTFYNSLIEPFISGIFTGIEIIWPYISKALILVILARLIIKVAYNFNRIIGYSKRKSKKNAKLFSESLDFINDLFGFFKK